jgi:hypothetical protein
MWSGDRGFGFLRRDDGQEEPMKTWRPAAASARKRGIARTRKRLLKRFETLGY